MRCLLFRGLCAAAFWLLPVPAFAYQGVDLGRDCRSGEDAPRARCEGFISGFLAGAQVDVDGVPLTMWRYYGYTWCGPAVFDLTEIVTTLFDAAGTGHATPHFPAALMLAQSLNHKFPCEELVTPRFPKPVSPLTPDQ